MSERESSSYDNANVFACLLRGEIIAEKFQETKHTVVIRDIAPQAPTHLLVFPKGAYTCFDDFMTSASPEEILDLWAVVKDAAISCGLAETGYRLISNKGRDAGQEVRHFHVHILGGEPLGPLVHKSA